MTTEQRLETLERELARVRRHNRRLMAAGAVVLLLTGAVVLTGAATPKNTDYSTSDMKFRSVEVRELVVADEKGTIRAVLAVTNEGAHLGLNDETGTRLT